MATNSAERGTECRHKENLNEKFNLYTGSARINTSREGYPEKVGAAMRIRPT